MSGLWTLEEDWEEDEAETWDKAQDDCDPEDESETWEEDDDLDEIAD